MRINAGAREHGMSYSELMGKIQQKLDLNRKTLADHNHKSSIMAFKAVIDSVK